MVATVVTELVTKPVSQDMAVVLRVRVVVLPAIVVFHLPAILVIPPVKLQIVLTVIQPATDVMFMHKTVLLIVGQTAKVVMVDIPVQTELAEVVIVQADKTLARLVTEPTLVLTLAIVVTEGVRAVLLVGTQEVVVQVSVIVVIADRVVEVDNNIVILLTAQADKTRVPLVTALILTALLPVGLHHIFIVKTVTAVVILVVMVVMAETAEVVMGVNLPAMLLPVSRVTIVIILRGVTPVVLVISVLCVTLTVTVVVTGPATALVTELVTAGAILVVLPAMVVVSLPVTLV